MSYINVRRRSTSRVNINNFLSGVNTAYDESILSPGVARQCYNFEFTSGALKSCKGFEDLGIEADSVWVCTLSGRRYLMYSRGGEIFFRTDTEEGKLDGVKLSGVPKAIEYRLYGEDVVLICSPLDNMVVWNGVDNAYYVGSSPLITSMTMHYERMFVTTSDERNTLWFSDDLDPTNWNADMSEGGFIELADERGALIKALGFLNYVYIFRERGISRLTAYADQSEFSVSHLFVTGGKIYPESIALCGDKVIFASSDGLFSFDGVSARRILTSLDGLLSPDEHSAAAYFGGKYYLALRANFDGDDGFPSGYVNNAVLIYGDDGYTIMRGYDIRAFCSGGDTLYAIENGKLCRFGGECKLPKRWTSPYTDLGSGRLKRIRELFIDTDSDITVTVVIDGEVKDYVVKGSKTATKININTAGRKFGMTIKSDGAPIISRPQLSFTVVDA